MASAIASSTVMAAWSGPPTFLVPCLALTCDIVCAQVCLLDAISLLPAITGLRGVFITLRSAGLAQRPGARALAARQMLLSTHYRLQATDYTVHIVLHAVNTRRRRL